MTPRQELKRALTNKRNKAMPPMSREAVQEFYRLRIHWRDAQRMLRAGTLNFDDAPQPAQPARDVKALASGEP
jgi:hypothetical protein